MSERMFCTMEAFLASSKSSENQDKRCKGNWIDLEASDNNASDHFHDCVTLSLTVCPSQKSRHPVIFFFIASLLKSIANTFYNILVSVNETEFY